MCYLFGALTKVKVGQFAIGILGMAIPNACWSYTGTMVNNIADGLKGENNKGYFQLGMMGIGLAFAFYGLYKVTKDAR